MDIAGKEHNEIEAKIRKGQLKIIIGQVGNANANLIDWEMNSNK